VRVWRGVIGAPNPRSHTLVGHDLDRVVDFASIGPARHDDLEAMLWVLEGNPRTRRFHELAGWRLDGAAKDETVLDMPVREVRYRIALRAPQRSAG
jgi:hypothetical protein